MTYKKGVSGNPNGRPVGSGSVGKYRQLLETRAPQLIDKLVDCALAGDMAALKICADRLIPPYRHSSPPIPLPVSPDSTLLEQSRRVLSGMALGELPGESWVFLKACRLLQEIEENSMWEQRIRAIEQSLQPTDHNPALDLDPDGNDDD